MDPEHKKPDRFYIEDQLMREYGIPREEIDLKTRVAEYLKNKTRCSYDRFVRFVITTIPILNWLPQYNVKQNLLGDVIAGFTVAIVHLPQGMAYGMLASLPPIHGLYVSFFPVLIYALLGTIRQVSIGTFAVVCIMIGEVVDEHVPDTTCSPTSTIPYTSEPVTHAQEGSSYTTSASFEGASCEEQYLSRRIEIAVSLCLAVGIIQIIMSLLRLGIVTVYLSEHLVSGFTCGSAFHVLTSQVPKLVGISVVKYSGPLSLVYTYIDLFSQITTINWATVIVSTICIVFLVIGKEINTRCYDKIPIPIPWEFAVVVFSTIASYYGLLNENHGVTVVGDIPTGLRVSMPKGPDIGAVMLEAIPIAVVVYAIEVSLGKMFALKHSYEVDSNQELLALGSSNIFSSFFSCFPCAASLSRSVIWDEVGGKTQITGLISSSLILVILLWIGPLFESLPQAALAAVIVVNLKRMLRQFEKIGPYWRVCKLDALTWIVTWASVVFLGVDIGLLVGLGFELATVVCNTQVANGSVLGEVQTTGEYKNVKRYETTQDEEKNIVVFSYPGPIYFANHERFKSQLIDAMGFDPAREASVIKAMEAKKEKIAAKTGKAEKGTEMVKRGVPNGGFTDTQMDKVRIEVEDDSGINSNIEPSSSDEQTNKKECDKDAGLDDGVIFAFGITYVILDMSACPFLDNDGAKTIKAMFSSLRSLDIEMLISTCNANVRQALTTVCKDVRPPFFLSLAGAIEYARGEVQLDFDEFGNIKCAANEEIEGTSL